MLYRITTVGLPKVGRWQHVEARGGEVV